MYFLSMLRTLSLLPLAASLAVASSFPVPVATYRAEGVKGDSAAVRVRVIIPEGWHIQSDAPLDDFLIPTEVTATGKDVAFGKPVFPKPSLKELAALGGQVALFEDTLDVRIPAKVRRSGDAAKALEGAKVSVRYQACNDSQCLPPRTIEAKFEK